MNEIYEKNQEKMIFLFFDGKDKIKVIVYGENLIDKIVSCDIHQNFTIILTINGYYKNFKIKDT